MAGGPDGRKTKTALVAHVNMMTDTIITSMALEGLQVIVRSLLSTHPEITPTFEAETRQYIQDIALPKVQARSSDISALKATQKTIRCMLGCGLSLQSVKHMGDLSVQGFKKLVESRDEAGIDDFLSSIDGDIVQLVTAIEKKLSISGRTQLSDEEREILGGLHRSLVDCNNTKADIPVEYPYSRALTSISILLGIPIQSFDSFSWFKSSAEHSCKLASVESKETFEINGRRLPRIFSGLWQMSSTSWGSAPTSKIIDQFVKYARAGMVAYDMADHYGDAEILFGWFNASYPQKGVTFAATKYCVFSPMTVTREAVQANVTERCRRLQTNKIDLLQFHWQFYNDPQYIDVLRFLEEDERVSAIGLCNFDTIHMERVLESGIRVHTNQVQFSLIDSRPVVRMAQACEKHNVKLLTYGTLCGGFLSDKWLGKDDPNLYAEDITPSQRKYHAMIRSWGGWELFQKLLCNLKAIASKHQVSISTVAVRWVLDWRCVGAVIVGTRMGLSEHADDNTASLGWSLDDEDRASIEKILMQSNRLDMFEDMGDCGGEYR